MNNLFKNLSSLVAMALFITACGAQVVQTELVGANTMATASYQAVLGRSLNNKDVADFIVNNNCSPMEHFQLCKDAGMAFWADSNQIVRTVYLYAGNADGLRRYLGELPFGLSFYDPMWRVEEKLRNQNVDDSFQQAGLPDEASSPDHMHYWAVYKQLGMTVIYNSPAADEDAYIYAVLVSK